MSDISFLLAPLSSPAYRPTAAEMLDTRLSPKSEESRLFPFCATDWVSPVSIFVRLPSIDGSRLLIVELSFRAPSSVEARPARLDRIVGTAAAVAFLAASSSVPRKAVNLPSTSPENNISRMSFTRFIRNSLRQFDGLAGNDEQAR